VPDIYDVAGNIESRNGAEIPGTDGQFRDTLTHTDGSRLTHPDLPREMRIPNPAKFRNRRCDPCTGKVFPVSLIGNVVPD